MGAHRAWGDVGDALEALSDLVREHDAPYGLMNAKTGCWGRGADPGYTSL